MAKYMHKHSNKGKINKNSIYTCAMHVRVCVCACLLACVWVCVCVQKSTEALGKYKTTEQQNKKQNKSPKRQHKSRQREMSATESERSGRGRQRQLQDKLTSVLSGPCKGFCESEPCVIVGNASESS